MSLDLFQLLPAVYRIRDAQLAQSQTLLTAAELADLNALQALTPPLTSDQQAQLDQLTAKASRGPLQSLLMLVEEQIAAVAYDLDQLYDDQFIETCACWVIPYIGDLIGYQSVKGISAAVDNPRSEVANTISLRRRKGTVLVMEQLARDVTGWGAHAVEFFHLLADTQYMNHIRLGNHYAPDLRRWQPGLYLDTGFDRTAHKVDVRRIASRRGRYNIQNIGIFLWPLGAYSITCASATPASTNNSTSQLCYRFSSLGIDIPLFHRAVSQGEQITAAAQPVNVPDRLRRRVLWADIQQGVGAAYYGESNSLVLCLDNQPLNPYQIQVASLCGADGSWANLPASLPLANSPYTVVIDPELGRIALSPPPSGSPAPSLTVSYYYGFNADMGGGEYSRSDSFTVTDAAWVVPFPDPRFSTLQDALNYAVGQFTLNGQVAVEVTGSDRLSMASALTVDLPAGTTLELRAADPSRPTLLLDGEFEITGDASSTFILNGFVVAAGSNMKPGPPASTRASPCAETRRHYEPYQPAQPQPLHARSGMVMVGRPQRRSGPRHHYRSHPHRRARHGRGHRRAIDPRRHPRRRAGHVQPLRQHRRRHRPHPSCVREPGWFERWRRRSHPYRMHRGRKGPRRPARDGLGQHLLVHARRPRRRSQAGRMRPVQLSAGQGRHAAHLRVRRAEAGRAAAAVLLATLRPSRVHEASHFH